MTQSQLETDETLEKAFDHYLGPDPLVGGNPIAGGIGTDEGSSAKPAQVQEVPAQVQEVQLPSVYVRHVVPGRGGTCKLSLANGDL